LPQVSPPLPIISDPFTCNAVFGVAVPIPTLLPDIAILLVPEIAVVPE
jgi:hypothetical protein